jgi:hypothetical protein
MPIPDQTRATPFDAACFGFMTYPLRFDCSSFVENVYFHRMGLISIL